MRKVLADEHGQHIMGLAKELAGPAGMLDRHRSARRPTDAWHYGYLFAPALTIGGGTGEVQRNIIAERVLGLPQGPRRRGRQDLAEGADRRTERFRRPVGERVDDGSAGRPDGPRRAADRARGPWPVRARRPRAAHITASTGEHGDGEHVEPDGRAHVEVGRARASRRVAPQPGQAQPGERPEPGRSGSGPPRCGSTAATYRPAPTAPAATERRREPRTPGIDPCGGGRQHRGQSPDGGDEGDDVDRGDDEADHGGHDRPRAGLLRRRLRAGVVARVPLPVHLGGEDDRHDAGRQAAQQRGGDRPGEVVARLGPRWGSRVVAAEAGEVVGVGSSSRRLRGGGGCRWLPRTYPFAAFGDPDPQSARATASSATGFDRGRGPGVDDRRRLVDVAQLAEPVERRRRGRRGHRPRPPLEGRRGRRSSRRWARRSACCRGRPSPGCASTRPRYAGSASSCTIAVDAVRKPTLVTPEQRSPRGRPQRQRGRRRQEEHRDAEAGRRR